MELFHYAENVYFHFYRKVEEVDFYLRMAVENNDQYKAATLPKDNVYFDRMQFSFSAFLSALVSCWEVARLSIQLENVLRGEEKNAGLPGEYALTQKQKFEKYFKVGDSQYYWFCLMKDFRNANSHDGSCAITGGNTELFLFQMDLHRFEWPKKGDQPILKSVAVPDISAVSSMLAMAYQLVPLFHSKLKKPLLNTEQSRAIVEFNMGHLKGKVIPDEQWEWAVAAALQARAGGTERNVSVVNDWEKMFRARFLWADKT